MAITAKVKVYKSPGYAGSDDVRLDFSADYGEGKNKEWATATPVINVMMYVKPEVAEKFESGKSYTLTFEPEE